MNFIVDVKRIHRRSVWPVNNDSEATAVVIADMPLKPKTPQIHASVHFENPVVLGALSTSRGKAQLLGEVVH